MAFDSDDYKTPQCKVIVDGSELKSSSYNIEQVNVQVSATEKANSAEVSIVADYDNENGSIGGSLLSKVTAGKKVQIELGYSRTTTVFLGYINSVDVNFSEGGVFVSFSCLDARGLLMGNISWQSHEKESVSQIIEALLKPLRSYTDGITVKVEGEADKENPLSQNDLDDYRYICHLAKLTNSTFYMPDTKLYFVKNPFGNASVRYKYERGKDIISFSRTVELSEQIGSITVTGNSPDTAEEFSATAKPPSGDGKNGAQLNSGVKDKERTVTSYTVKTQEEAQKYADSMMLETALKLCSGSAKVPGNEKLTPGEGVSFEGLDPEIDGKYLITSLTHSFSAGGFVTTIGFSSSTT